MRCRLRRGRHLAWRNREAISAARQRANVPRCFRRIAQGGADLIHAEIDAALEVQVLALAPEPLADFLSGDNLAGTSGQQHEDSKCLWMQPARDPVLAQ